MTLEEFRRTWIRDHVGAESAPAPVPAAAPLPKRLMFVPPQETKLVPRMVFREVFVSPPPVDRKPRARMRQVGVRLAWAIAACFAAAVMGLGMSKIFDYAPTYMSKYLGTLH
ncbi:hypothetical protein [Brevundimonas variabilis]|uniref:Uncharacterized protein n=1 Tax=Brevundimonas variabilis TaxID=74312 RepID=A0A7W9FEI3_9CAUL|nr:hypothetical protein [Brevundimonas variabilis]MBB5746352.1 hypothetical protein [Brevundimonas variabilis]